MSNAEVEREIIEALEASSEPLDRHALFKECPSALSADHVSRALNSLKKRDIVQNFGAGRWGLTGDYEDNAAHPAESKAAQFVGGRKQLKLATLQRLAEVVSDDIREVLMDVIRDVEAAA